MTSAFVNQLIKVAEDEYAYFGNGTKKEYQSSVYLRVGEYWTELAKTPPYGSWSGYNGRSGVTFDKKGKVTSNKNQPWSAAFISYVMSIAGAGKDFSYAPSHSVYIVKALDDAKKTKPAGKFIARRHKLYTPKLGDLIACERKPKIDPNFDTYKKYVAAGHYEAHCDIVTEVHDKHVITIGGNVNNSVSQKKWLFDTGKMIDDHDPGSSTSGVICIIENLL